VGFATSGCLLLCYEICFRTRFTWGLIREQLLSGPRFAEA